jgi:hypothetical protein
MGSHPVLLRLIGKAAVAVAVHHALSSSVTPVGALTCAGVCPNGTAMQFPDRGYNWSMLDDTFSCAAWDQDIRVPYKDDRGEEACSFDANRTFWIDMASFCGCDGYVQPVECDFCPSGNLINPETRIDAPEGSDLEFSLTCEQAAVATKYVSNELTCLELKLLFAPECCDEGQSGASSGSRENSTNTSPPSSAPESSLSRLLVSSILVACWLLLVV